MKNNCSRSIGIDSPEDATRRSIPVALPSSSPIKRYDRKTIPIHETSDENKWHCYDALLNFASFDLKFEPRIWTTCANKRKACSIACSIVQTSYGRFGVFSDPCVGHISPPMNKSKWGRRSVCWCMINTVRVKKSIQNTSKLSGTLPSKGCVSTLAGPARIICRYVFFTHTGGGCPVAKKMDERAALASFRHALRHEGTLSTLPMPLPLLLLSLRFSDWIAAWSQPADYRQ